VTTCLIAVLGVCIGIATGLLGAGGSILTTLLLLHPGGLDIRAAITTSLVVVAGMSLVATVPYALARAIVWRAAAFFGVASMAGAWTGGRIAARLPPRVLLLIFFLTMMLAASAMLWERRPPPEGAPRRRNDSVWPMAVGGFLIGTLTGTVGLGGGFAVVPLLVVFARAPVRSAVGTSILLIAMNTLAGLAGHLPHPPIRWSVAAYLGAAESVGGLMGAHLARHVGVNVLRRGFACLMLASAGVLLGLTMLR
jgi:uncharacterized membrane protein YfcA